MRFQINGTTVAAEPRPGQTLVIQSELNSIQFRVRLLSTSLNLSWPDQL